MNTCTGTAADYIPPITEPLGKYWNQPPLEEILMDDQHAAMTVHTLRRLGEYSRSDPSGVYDGKCWRFDSAPNRPLEEAWDPSTPRHWLRWYCPSPDPKLCSIKSLPILLLVAKHTGPSTPPPWVDEIALETARLIMADEKQQSERRLAQIQCQLVELILNVSRR